MANCRWDASVTTATIHSICHPKAISSGTLSIDHKTMLEESAALHIRTRPADKNPRKIRSEEDNRLWSFLANLQILGTSSFSGAILQQTRPFWLVKEVSCLATQFSIRAEATINMKAWKRLVTTRADETLDFQCFHEMIKMFRKWLLRRTCSNDAFNHEVEQWRDKKVAQPCKEQRRLSQCPQEVMNTTHFSIGWGLGSSCGVSTLIFPSGCNSPFLQKFELFIFLPNNPPTPTRIETSRLVECILHKYESWLCTEMDILISLTRPCVWMRSSVYVCIMC